MSKTKFRLLLSTLLLLSAGAAANAQTVSQNKNDSQSKTMPATIAEMTKLARELRVATLQKELREAREQKNPNTVVNSLPPVPPPKASIAPRRTVPLPPAVAAVWGTSGVLKARLATGQDIQNGSIVGPWRVISIAENGVSFERCEQARKATNTPVCEVQFVSPASIS